VNLYEITTGWCGESYERCYVWAPDEHTAATLFTEKYPDKAIRGELRHLMTWDDEPFVTDLSDSGWER
jgi:hypothetical protein